MKVETSPADDYVSASEGTWCTSELAFDARAVDVAILGVKVVESTGEWDHDTHAPDANSFDTLGPDSADTTCETNESVCTTTSITYEETRTTNCPTC